MAIRLELSVYKMLQKKVSRNWVYIALSLSLSPSLSSIPTVALPAIQHSRGRCRSRPAAFFSSILPPFLSNVINIIYYFRVRPAQRRIRVYFFHPALPCPSIRPNHSGLLPYPTQSSNEKRPAIPLNLRSRHLAIHICRINRRRGHRRHRRQRRCGVLRHSTWDWRGWCQSCCAVVAGRVDFVPGAGCYVVLLVWY
jgi:hypothetical protein